MVGRPARTPGAWGFDDLAAGLALVTAAALATFTVPQSDTWWHLRAGKDLWHGTSTLTDHWSWTAAGRHWPDHEIGWQLLAYPVYALGGLPLLAVLSGALATAALVLSWRLAPRRGGLALVLLFLAIPGVATISAMRPQVASALCLAVLLHLLVRERFAWIPVLFVAWANVHGAVAIGGWVLLAVTAVALVSRDRRRVHLIVTTVVSGLATLATPLGFGLWSYVADSVGGARSPDSPRASISEWKTSFHLDPAALAFWAWLAVLVVLAALAVRDRRRPVGWSATVTLTAAVALVPLGASLERNVAFFLLAALPAAITLLPPPRPRAPEALSLAKPIVAGYAVLGAVLVGLVQAFPPASLDRDPVPPAMRAAVRACPGPLYNTYDAGGPLLWFVPQVKVFLDSRQDPYPDAFVNADHRAESTGSLAPLETRYRFGCAVVGTGTPLARTLPSQGWRTTYAGRDWLVLRAPE